MAFQKFDSEPVLLTLSEWKHFWKNKYHERQMRCMGDSGEDPGSTINETFGSGPHFEIAADYRSGRVLEVKGFEQVLGIDAQKPRQGRAEYLASIVHPDDINKVLGLSVYFHRFVENQSETLRSNFKGSVIFRMRNNKGEYIRVLEEVTFLPDRSGKIVYELKHFTDISHFHHANKIVLAVLDDDKSAKRQSLYTFDLEKKAPNTIEHALLRSKKGNWNSSSQVVSYFSMPIWFTEGMAEYCAVKIEQEHAVPKFDLFRFGGYTKVDSSCVKQIRGEWGEEILSFMGDTGVPIKLFTSSRKEFAPPFYTCACSFTKYLAETYGMEKMLSAISNFEEEQNTIEELTGKEMELLKADWLKQLGVTGPND